MNGGDSSSHITPWRWRRTGGSLTMAASLLLSVSVVGIGCDKTPPPDPNIQKGYAALAEDPQAAYTMLSQARDQNAPQVLLGRGLALEMLRKYEDAERLIRQAYEKADEPIAALSLARVLIVLGRIDEARPLVDQVVKAVPSDLSALLLETCLSRNEQSARTTLAHLEHWREISINQKNGLSAAPSEYYLAKKVLSQQLKLRKESRVASAKAERANISDERSAFGLVELAVKAGRRDLAVELLRKLNEQDKLGEQRETIVKLAHGLGEHELVAQILEVLPATNRALVTLRAEHQFMTGQSQAHVSLRDALAATKDDAVRARLWPMLIEALLQSGKPEEAQVEAEKMLEKFPTEQGLLLSARIELKLNQPEAALKRLAPLLEKDDSPSAASEVAAIAHQQLGQPNSALPLLLDILKKDPGHLRAAQLAMALETSRGKPEEAVRILKDLVSRAPENGGLRLLLAEAERSAKGNAAAVASLQLGVAAVKTDARLWIALAQALERDGANAESVELLEKAHKELPHESMLTAALATRLAESGKAKRAAELYEMIIEDAQGDALSLNNLAMLYVDELGNADRGVELAEKAYALSKAPGIADTFGWALFKRNRPKDPKRARELLMSVRDQLTSPSSKYHLGAVLIANGELDEGKALLKQAITLSTDFAEFAQARELLAGTK